MSRGGICWSTPRCRHPFIPPSPTKTRRGFRGNGASFVDGAKRRRSRKETKKNRKTHRRLRRLFARADDRLSVGKRLIKEPGSNPDHTALPNPLVSSPSGRRVARADSQEKTRKPNAAAPESARKTRCERRSVPYMPIVIMGTVIKTEIHVKAPSAPPRHRDALGSASMSVTKGSF